MTNNSMEITAIKIINQTSQHSNKMTSIITETIATHLINMEQVMKTTINKNKTPINHMPSLNLFNLRSNNTSRSKLLINRNKLSNLSKTICRGRRLLKLH